MTMHDKCDKMWQNVMKHNKTWEKHEKNLQNMTKCKKCEKCDKYDKTWPARHLCKI